MNLVIFHGSPRKGNTYRATGIFLDELKKQGDIRLTEFYLPKALPVFCTGCQMCLSGSHEKCPHAQHVEPILTAILKADALVFTTPHYGACSMSAGMKSLLDHLDFLTMNVAPREELFRMKAFILTTATGSAAAIKPIRSYLVNWGVNRVDTLGIRMYIDKWDKMPEKKRAEIERKLRKKARRFYALSVGHAPVTSIFMYYIFKMILRRYVGEDAYPYQYWKEKGYFKKRPF